MSTWLVPRDELTPEQLRAIELDPSEHRLILGGPGSGKTQILLHRGQHLRDLWGVEPSRFRLFVYTKALKQYIRSALGLLDLPEECVSTLDSWCTSTYRAQTGRKLPRVPGGKQPDFDAIRKAVLRIVENGSIQPYDFVLVDEAQDLNEVAFRLLRGMAKHITICADHKQQIYDDGSRIDTITTHLRLRRENVALLDTYRCCPYLVKLSAQLLDGEEKDVYIRQARTDQTERETPLLIRAQSADQERKQIFDMVRIRLARGERIAVLFPQQRQAYGFAKGLMEEGIDCENPRELDFTTDKPKLMPYHSAKGLTFDTVLMPRLVDKSFGRVSYERIVRLLFVGITRATRWVCLSTVKGGRMTALNRLIAIANDGCLAIRECGGVAATAKLPFPDPVSDPPKDDEDKDGNDDFLDLL